MHVLWQSLTLSTPALSRGNAYIVDTPFHLGGSVEGGELFDEAAIALAADFGLNAMQLSRSPAQLASFNAHAEHPAAAAARIHSIEPGVDPGVDPFDPPPDHAPVFAAARNRSVPGDKQALLWYLPGEPRNNTELADILYTAARLRTMFPAALYHKMLTYSAMQSDLNDELEHLFMSSPDLDFNANHVYSLDETRLLLDLARYRYLSTFHAKPVFRFLYSFSDVLHTPNGDDVYHLRYIIIATVVFQKLRKDWDLPSGLPYDSEYS